MMIRVASVSAAVLACLAGGCSPGDMFDTGYSRTTMFLIETNVEPCRQMARDKGAEIVITPVEIGQYVYAHDPESGLVCRTDGERRPVAAFVQGSTRLATHSWVRETGLGILGTRHTFGPLPADRTPT